MMPVPTPVTAMQAFLDYLKFEKRYSAHTLLAYGQDLAGFFDFLENEYGGLELTSITHTFIRGWLVHLQGDEKNGARSINRKISTLKSFFKYLLREGAVKSSPVTKVISPKISKRLPVFIKEDEILPLLDTLQQSAEDWKTLNARILINLFYATGMRLSELISLKESHIDAGRGSVKVLGKGNKERVIPVSREMLVMIAEYRQLKRKEFENPEEALLVTEKGKKLYPKYAYLLVKKYLGEAATLEKKSPHVLRHTFATHLLNKGAELNAVKELLGHSSLSATQVYTHNTIDKLKDVYKKAHPKA